MAVVMKSSNWQKPIGYVDTIDYINTTIANITS